MNEQHIAEIVASAVYDPHNTQRINADVSGAFASGVVAHGTSKHEVLLTVNVFDDEDVVIVLSPTYGGVKVEAVLPVYELDNSLVYEVALSLHRHLFRRNRWSMA